jgi:hypothetical protein
VARKGWVGAFLFMGKGSSATLHAGSDVYREFIEGVDERLFDLGHTGSTTRMPSINLEAANGVIVTGCPLSQPDMLAEDWMVLEPVAKAPAFDPTIEHSGEESESTFGVWEREAQEKIIDRIRPKIPEQWRRYVTMESHHSIIEEMLTVRWKFKPPAVTALNDGSLVPQLKV